MAAAAATPSRSSSASRTRSTRAPCEIYYRDIGDYLTREQKLRIVADGDLATVDWQAISPSPEGDWINQRDDNFSTWPVIGDKKSESISAAMFRTYSAGLKTGRDSWCYSYSCAGLGGNVLELLSQYQQAQVDFEKYRVQEGITKAREDDVSRWLSANPHLTGLGRISWNRGLKQDLAKSHQITWSDESVRLSAYRPFCAQWVYLDRHVNDMIYQVPSVFPTPHHINLGYYAIGVGATADFSLLIVNKIPDVQMLGAGQNGQFFPAGPTFPLATTAFWSSYMMRSLTSGVIGASTT